MTAEEWYALDKKPGMKFRTSDNKIGRLVSVHKDGATLDFTNADGYTHVVRGFYRCVQLSDPDAPLPEVEKPEVKKPKVEKPEVKKTEVEKRLARRVMRVKTGVIYESTPKAAWALHVSPESVRKSATFGVTIKRGPGKGERFRFVD